MAEMPDVAAGRLPPERIAANFADIHPPLTNQQALVETSRCYFCHDAPCVAACPTGIDVPNFIRKIATGNLKGSARTILDANIMGGMCARVCSTEVLCEGACVRNLDEHKPVAIGALQRHATDWLFDRREQLYRRGAPTGKRVAVVGAGPAGIACAHRLAVLGHAVVVFEAQPKPGGLNEYGIAAYKVPDDFAQKELAWILEIGGIEIRYGQALGRDVTLTALRREFDAVFLGIGLSGVNGLGLEAEDLPGVLDAVRFIAALRQAPDLGAIAVGRRVVVVGGGSTAIDVAVQSRRLGAEDVTIVYRRGPESMSATAGERDFAQVDGVRVRHWARPVELVRADGHVGAVTFERTMLDAAGRLVATGDHYTLAADQVFKAIGQLFVSDPLGEGGLEPLDVADGRLAVNAERETSLPGVFAGGDCIAGGHDLTVDAVQDGKVAAGAIDRRLRARDAAAA